MRETTRRLVEFRRVNLAESFTSLGAFDLICCRNVLIYFDQPTRQRICRQFHTMLAEGGRLLLGSAENLYGISDDFVSLPLGKALDLSQGLTPWSDGVPHIWRVLAAKTFDAKPMPMSAHLWRTE